MTNNSREPFDQGAYEKLLNEFQRSNFVARAPYDLRQAARPPPAPRVCAVSIGIDHEIYGERVTLSR